MIPQAPLEPARSPSAAVLTSRALARMLDDASQFPPGNMELRPAWEGHLRWRAHEHCSLVGRFLVPARRAEELAQLMPTDDRVELGIVVGAEQPEDVTPILDAASAIELRGDPSELGRWRAQAPHGWIFLEGAPLQEIADARTDDHRIGAKLRCGGIQADAFPNCEQVASFIADCVRLDVPFKATAGLHGPLRHWDPEIGVYHHGFLNLWTATAAAARGAPARELAAALAAEELGGLPALAPEELERARHWFTALGTCSIAEPLEGLQALRLLGDG
jgi:hypothetical protein